LSLGSFLSAWEFTFNNIPRGYTITIAWSLQLQQSFYQLVHNLRCQASTIGTLYSHGLLPQDDEEPQASHVVSTTCGQVARQLSHVLGDILQDGSVTGGGQLVKVTQLLAPFVV
jgi:hypothetical protein